MQTHDHYIVYDAERKGAPTLGNAPARVFDGPGDVAEELCGGMAETISLAILREDFETGGLHDRHVQYVVVGELSPHAPVPGALRERSNRDPQSRNITIVRITHGLGRGLIRDPVQEIADAAHRPGGATTSEYTPTYG